MIDSHIVGSLDITQLVFFAFVLFFVGLIFYLRREDRREGYPLEDEATGLIESYGIGFFGASYRDLFAFAVLLLMLLWLLRLGSQLAGTLTRGTGPMVTTNALQIRKWNLPTPNGFDCCGDVDVHGRNDLSTICCVHLVTVVGGWVVTRCDYDCPGRVATTNLVG